MLIVMLSAENLKSIELLEFKLLRKCHTLSDYFNKGKRNKLIINTFIHSS